MITSVEDELIKLASLGNLAKDSDNNDEFRKILEKQMVPDYEKFSRLKGKSSNKNNTQTAKASEAVTPKKNKDVQKKDSKQIK